MKKQGVVRFYVRSSFPYRITSTLTLALASTSASTLKQPKASGPRLYIRKPALTPRYELCATRYAGRSGGFGFCELAAKVGCTVMRSGGPAVKVLLGGHQVVF